MVRRDRRNRVRDKYRDRGVQLSDNYRTFCCRLSMLVLHPCASVHLCVCMGVRLCVSRSLANSNVCQSVSVTDDDASSDAITFSASAKRGLLRRCKTVRTFPLTPPIPWTHPEMFYSASYANNTFLSLSLSLSLFLSFSSSSLAYFNTLFAFPHLFISSVHLCVCVSLIPPYSPIHACFW